MKDQIILAKIILPTDKTIVLKQGILEVAECSLEQIVFIYFKHFCAVLLSSALDKDHVSVSEMYMQS